MNDKPIIISYPCPDMVHADFTHCLNMLLLYSLARSRLWVGCSQTRGSIICASRNMMVRQADNAETGYSHLLMLDSDMVFPANTLERLLRHDKQIVGVSYCMRTQPRALTHRNEDFSTTLPPLGDHENNIYQVRSLGMGCVLIREDVFRLIKQHYPLQPFFSVEYHGDYDHTGEDVGFFKKASMSGIPVFCDIELSHEVRHVGMYPYGPNDVQRVYDGSEPQFELSRLQLPHTEGV